MLVPILKIFFVFYYLLFSISSLAESKDDLLNQLIIDSKEHPLSQKTEAKFCIFCNIDHTLKEIKSTKNKLLNFYQKSSESNNFLDDLLYPIKTDQFILNVGHEQRPCDTQSYFAKNEKWDFIKYSIRDEESIAIDEKDQKIFINFCFKWN